MFSKGTYNRYLFEIDSTHRKMREKYNQLSGNVQDPEVRKVVDDFVRQIDAEQAILEEIRTMVVAVE